MDEATSSFDNLTETQVLDWVKNTHFITDAEAAEVDEEGFEKHFGNTVTQCENDLLSRMDKKINTNPVTSKLPNTW